MKAMPWFLLSLLLSVPVLAQQPPPPVNARATVDANGLVTVQWMEPFNPEYAEEYDDNITDGWVYEIDATFTVQEGLLHMAWDSIYGDEYASAYYAAETYGDGVFEVSCARAYGDLSRPLMLQLYTSGLYPDNSPNGYLFCVSPSNDGDNFPGGMKVYKVVNGHNYQLAGGLRDVINEGLNAFNTLQVAVQDHSIAFYINGHEMAQFYEPDDVTGFVGIGGHGYPTSFGNSQSARWDYVRIDDAQIPNPQLYSHYEVYRNGELIAEPETESFSETLTEYGAHQYLIVAQYINGVSAADTAEVFYHDPARFVIDADFETGLPEGWSTESNHPDHDWHVDYGDEVGFFDTPYMLINDLGAAGLEARLLLPEIDVSTASLVRLEYDYILQDIVDDGGNIWMYYRLDGGPWDVRRIISHETPDTLHAVADMTDYIEGASTLQISFLYDDFGFNDSRFGLDNVRVYVDSDTPDPVTFNLDPVVTTIPDGGGVVVYDAQLVNNTGSSFSNIQFWTEVDLPNGTTFGPLTSLWFSLQPMQQISQTGIQQIVPDYAPAGEYVFRARVGYPQGPYLTDTFTFTKQGAAAADVVFEPEDWGSRGWAGDFASNRHPAAPHPSQFELCAARPNPFNPSTTLQVVLPEAADLDLAVYNAAGQRVTQLADGPMSAGTHSFTFDVSTTHLASGVYFIHARVDGRMSQVQKVLLLR